jgi:transcription termination factor NusB
MSKKIQKIESKVIEETFKNKQFADAVAEAIGDNLIKAIRTIDDWNFSYELKNLMGEILFSEEFKEEIKSYAQAYITENKDDIKQLVKDKMATTIINGVTEAADKVGSLLVDKIKDVSKIY